MLQFHYSYLSLWPLQIQIEAVYLLLETSQCTVAEIYPAVLYVFADKRNSM